MEIQDIEKRVAKLEESQQELKEFVNKSIGDVNKSMGDIQIGIAEIKIILTERLKQENLKNDLLSKDIKSQNDRIKKLEDNQQWLWRTVAGSIISIVIGAIVFAIKLMN